MREVRRSPHEVPVLTEGRRRYSSNPFDNREVRNDNRIFIDKLRKILRFRVLEVHGFLIEC
jgi:hypothetical protein